MNTPSNNEIKQALGYALTVAMQGKLNASPAESEVILKNLGACKAIMEAIPSDERLDEEKAVKEDAKRIGLVDESK